MDPEVYKDRDGNLIYPPQHGGEAGPPYYLMRRNSLTGNMDQVCSSMDFKEIQAARRKEILFGLSYSSPRLEIWSTRIEGFGSGTYE